MPRVAIVKPRIDTLDILAAHCAKAKNHVPEILEQSFFARPALQVARALIGKCLVRRVAGKPPLVWPITETEAYIGAHDLACHGRFGKTERTKVMYGPAGHWYVYFIYGMYWMLNVVTNRVDVPAAVLIRAAGPANGPGKLTREMSITRTLNGREVVPESRLWIEDWGLKIPQKQLARTKRIGIDYADEWKEKPYRFVWAANDG